jgi:hypothetical protein
MKLNSDQAIADKALSDLRRARDCDDATTALAILKEVETTIKSNERYSSEEREVALLALQGLIDTLEKSTKLGACWDKAIAATTTWQSKRG